MNDAKMQSPVSNLGVFGSLLWPPWYPPDPLLISWKLPTLDPKLEMRGEPHDVLPRALFFILAWPSFCFPAIPFLFCGAAKQKRLVCAPGHGEETVQDFYEWGRFNGCNATANVSDTVESHKTTRMTNCTANSSVEPLSR
ncbi:unnamed protein product [Symbiodinium natans]|uniref:Uncharacterized protein n=1 Tax=Symbiodinium natans TaxID=878477 RepID=A0A812LR07_9DINO|nr:unnamed protein product [Symbiodinium natans]